MGHQITALYTYPIKSCGALSHAEMTLNARGLKWDRHWMIVEADGKAGGMFITGRDMPRMALIQPSLGDEVMTLTAPNMPAITVPMEQDVRARQKLVKVCSDHVQAIDEGDIVAQWLSDFLKRKVRLVAIADDFSRIVDTEFVDKPTETGFSDGYPLLLISEESLGDLNQRLNAKGEPSVPMSRFRTNVVVSGGQPFDEDTWRHAYLGDVPFDIVKPCKRCQMVTVNWVTGEIHNPKEPTATLASFRRWNGGVIFGQNIVHRGLGTLRVSDSVRVEVAADGWIEA